MAGIKEKSRGPRSIGAVTPTGAGLRSSSLVGSAPCLGTRFPGLFHVSSSSSSWDGDGVPVPCLLLRSCLVVCCQASIKPSEVTAKSLTGAFPAHMLSKKQVPELPETCFLSTETYRSSLGLGRGRECCPKQLKGQTGERMSTRGRWCTQEGVWQPVRSVPAAATEGVWNVSHEAGYLPPRVIQVGKVVRSGKEREKSSWAAPKRETAVAAPGL